MLLAAIALALAAADVVDEMLRVPPPPLVAAGEPSMTCCVSHPRIKSVDLPALAAALGGDDRAARTRAANHLAEYLEDHDPPEAIVLLIPWIGDPSWADETRKGARTMVVQRVAWRQMAIAVPELMRARDGDPSPEFRAEAAWALDRIAGDDDDPRKIVRAADDHPDDVAALVNASIRGRSLRTEAAAELALLRSRGGIRAGIAAAIVGDPADMRSVLAGDDADAIRALLAAARLQRAALPQALVRELPRRLPATKSAVAAYLATKAER